jgi:hypothetical protein
MDAITIPIGSRGKSASLNARLQTDEAIYEDHVGAS